LESEELVLITRGRKTGREHRVRLWFARDGDLLWLRADERHPPDSEEAGWIRRRPGRRPDWYLNLRAEPRCRVLVEGEELEARFQEGAPAEGASDLRRLVELWRGKYGAEWVQDWYVEKGRVPVKVRLLPK
jgi:F420H(2)-dependent quinone reductase